jgi:guanosine-3',5'-bis(diphosphate) 3'-pyrophosphohydrolase
MAAHAPQGWELARRREYYDWAKKVIDEIRGTHARLEAAFDEAYAARP